MSSNLLRFWGQCLPKMLGGWTFFFTLLHLQFLHTVKQKREAKETQALLIYQNPYLPDPRLWRCCMIKTGCLAQLWAFLVPRRLWYETNSLGTELQFKRDWALGSNVIWSDTAVGTAVKEIGRDDRSSVPALSQYQGPQFQEGTKQKQNTFFFQRFIWTIESWLDGSEPYKAKF